MLDNVLLLLLVKERGSAISSRSWSWIRCQCESSLLVSSDLGFFSYEVVLVQLHCSCDGHVTFAVAIVM
jgi:hypothetical protein